MKAYHFIYAKIILYAKSMSFVCIVISILVNDSFFFAQALFISIIPLLQFVHLVFLPYQRHYIYLFIYIYIPKAPFLSFSQGPHTTLIHPGARCCFLTNLQCNSFMFACNMFGGLVRKGSTRNTLFLQRNVRKFRWFVRLCQLLVPEL